MSRAEWESHFYKTLCGVSLASRSIAAMPIGSVQQRVSRAEHLMRALRVMRMGEWRPTFPFLPLKDSP